jgi:hypothetical protein
MKINGKKNNETNTTITLFKTEGGIFSIFSKIIRGHFHRKTDQRKSPDILIPTYITR